MFTVAAPLALALALAVAGCGGERNSPVADNEDAPGQSTESVVLGEPMAVTTLDPLLAYQATDIRAVSLIGGRLFSYDQAGNVGPGLAESSAVAPDELSWTFTLRPDLKFSDGSPLTSTDVVASLERARTDETNIYSAMTAPWKSVSAVDPRTVRIDLNMPSPNLKSVLSYPFTTIVPAAHADDPEYYRSPVSAGMFSLESWDESADAQFVRNENYWESKPIVKNVTMTSISDPNTRLDKVRSGEVNFAPDIPPSLIDEVADPVSLVTTQLNGFYSLVPNNTMAPFDNYGVRKAISLAVDRAQINDEVWHGKSQPLAGFWPPTMDGYDQSVPTGRDVAGAKAALQGTPCEKGCTSELYYTSAYSGEAEMAAILKQNLADIGITVSIHDLDATTLYSRLAEGGIPMAITLNWDYLNQPAGLLNYTLQQGGSQANWSFYNSEQMNQLIDLAIQQSGEELAATLAEIDALFQQDVPYINLTPSPTFAAVNLAEDDLVVESTSATYDFDRQ